MSDPGPRLDHFSVDPVAGRAVMSMEAYAHLFPDSDDQTRAAVDASWHVDPDLLRISPTR